MDFTFALIAAIAVVTSIAVAVFVVWETFALWFVPKSPQVVMQAGVVDGPSHGEIIARGLCEPDGVAITTGDRLRMLITSLDVMVVKGEYSMLQVTSMADQFARNQPAPDVTLAHIQKCEPWLQETHGYGYGVLTSALTREAVARRMVPSHPSYVRAAAR